MQYHKTVSFKRSTDIVLPDRVFPSVEHPQLTFWGQGLSPKNTVFNRLISFFGRRDAKWA